MNACTRRCVLCFRHSRSEPEPINTGDSCRVHWRGFRCWLYTLTMKTDVSGCEWVCCPEWKTYWTLPEVFNRLPRQQCSPLLFTNRQVKDPLEHKRSYFQCDFNILPFCGKGVLWFARPCAPYWTIFREQFFLILLSMQNYHVRGAIQLSTLTGRALCFPNNQLRSSSAHHHWVISIHNNTAASEMCQEAEAPQI